MPNEGGTWIMYGVEEDDPYCIHTAEQLMDYIEEVGFLPLFKNEIPGFSVEERTVAHDWWSGDSLHDPWEWREIIARSGRMAYGKFFNKKAGFISLKWLPVFANHRRDGYDFDSLWEDGKASRRSKKLMDLFEEEEMIFSNEMKRRAGFGKDGEKNFDGVLTELQMQLYLCPMDFRQRKNKQGQEYGWPIAVYSMPEQRWGYDLVTGDYKEKPEMSGQKIYEHIKERYPIAEDRAIKKVVGVKNSEGK